MQLLLAGLQGKGVSQIVVERLVSFYFGSWNEHWRKLVDRVEGFTVVEESEKSFREGGWVGEGTGRRIGG